MKKLTKKVFKKEIKSLVSAEMNSFEAMESLQNEYPDYTIMIMDAHTDYLMESL